MIINLKKNSIDRISKNQKIFFDFNKSTCNIETDDLKLIFKIEVLELKKLNNYFYVCYLIENDNFELEIKII